MVFLYFIQQMPTLNAVSSYLMRETSRLTWVNSIVTHNSPKCQREHINSMKIEITVQFNFQVLSGANWWLSSTSMLSKNCDSYVGEIVMLDLISCHRHISSPTSVTNIGVTRQMAPIYFVILSKVQSAACLATFWAQILNYQDSAISWKTSKSSWYKMLVPKW